MSKDSLAAAPMPPRIHGVLYPAPSEGLPLLVAIFKDGGLVGCNIAADPVEGEGMIATAVAELQRLEIASKLPPSITVMRPVQRR